MFKLSIMPICSQDCQSCPDLLVRLSIVLIIIIMLCPRSYVWIGLEKEGIRRIEHMKDVRANVLSRMHPREENGASQTHFL